MRVQELGTLSGEILLFGGVYSNLAAFDTVIALSQSRGIAPQNMICTGDIVAYCADGNACVDRIRALGCPVLRGNCETQLFEDAPDCGCGYGVGSTCSLLSRRWYAHAQKTVTLENKDWMGMLPDRIVLTHFGNRYAVVHGGASDVSTFVWPVASDRDLTAEMELATAQVGPINGVIAGHSGMAMDRSVASRRWINAGAVGMPPNDGDPRGSFAVLNGDNVSFVRFDYDYRTTQRAMVTAGLTQGYDTALETGYWPSEDTLPIEMRRQSSASG